MKTVWIIVIILKKLNVEWIVCVIEKKSKKSNILDMMISGKGDLLITDN